MKSSQSSGKKKKRASGATGKPDKRERERSGSSRSPRSSRRAPGPVLGLDLSMTGCGVVVLSPTGKVLRKRKYKTYPVPPSEGLKLRPRGQRAQDRFVGDDEERIAWLKRKILLALDKYEVCFVVIEAHAFAAKGRGKTILSELHGVIKNALHDREIAFITQSPQAIKKHVTGNGNAQKMDVIVAAKEFDRDISNSDTADAWACAKLGVDRYYFLTE
jgi:Holliday junction resolvasome RuvABC endonuclease subunit